MAAPFATPNSLLGFAAPKLRSANPALGFAIALAGTAILALSAKLSIPFIPVPATFQTLAVAALAAAFGWRIGVMTMVLYIAEGLSGLPVFATGGGPAYVFAPSFGFILGWLPMMFIIGRAADAGASRRPLSLFAAMLLGDAVGFAFGYAWLVALWIGAGTFAASTAFSAAFGAAVQPFIVWDVLKMAFAALTVTGGWALLSRRAE